MTDRPPPPGPPPSPWSQPLPATPPGQPAPPAPPAPPAVGLASPPPGPPGGGLPLYTPAEPPPTPRRSPARLAAVAIGAVALLAATGFAAYALTRPDGADSPEGAVRQMFDAIDQEDALGVIEGLPAGERRMLRDPLVDASKELERLGIVEGFSLSDVPGADLEVDDLQLSSTRLGNGVTLVDVEGGTISGRSIPEDVPIGDNLRQLVEDGGGDVDFEAGSFTQDLADADLHLVAIEEGGGWHVSLAYSIAEAARGSSEDDDGHPLPVPDFGNGLVPVGSDSPEGAVRGMVDAAVALDAEQAITLTDPQEMAALYDYAPLFLSDLGDAVQDLGGDDGDDEFAVQVDRLDTAVEGEGPVRRVSITGFDVTMGIEGDEVHMVYDGTCYEVTTTSTSTWVTELSSPVLPTEPYPDEPYPTEPTVEPETQTERVCVGDPESDDSSGSSLFGSLGTFGSASARPFAITVSEVDGRWYVSPVRTILDNLVDGLRGLEPSDVESWGDWFGSSATEESSSSLGPLESGSGGSGSGGSTGSVPTTALSGSGLEPDPDLGLDSTTMLQGSDSMASLLFMGLSPATIDQLAVTCSAELAAHDDALSGGGQVAYYATMRDAYRCAAAVVPGYEACLPTLDAAVLAAENDDPLDDDAIGDAYACLFDVTE